MMYEGNHMFGGMGIRFFFFWLILLAAIALIIVTVVWMVKPKNNSNRPQHDDALQILRNRLARGEISDEEYDRLKKKLED